MYIFKDLKYTFDHCTKLSEIKMGALDANLLTNISPHLAFKGHLVIDGEVSLEELKAKLPNLNDVVISCHFSATEYVTRFCTHFPLLDKLYFDVESSDELTTATSSLQNLRTLHLPSSFTEDQVYTIIKSLPNLEDLNMYHPALVHDQSFLYLAKMPRLHKLTIDVEPAYKNLHLLTNADNFPKLRYLEIYLDLAYVHNTGSWSVEVQAQLKNHRSALNVTIRRYTVAH